MKNYILLLFFIALLLGGCGGDEQPQSDAIIYKMQYLPEKNSITIPDSLLADALDHSKKSAGASDDGPASTVVRRSITKAEVSRLSNQAQLLLLDAVWPEVESYCQEMVPDTPCNIPQGTIVLRLTEEIIAAAETVVVKIAELGKQEGGVFVTDESGKPARLSVAAGDEIGLPAIVYTVFSEGNEYRYEVVLDIAKMVTISDLERSDALSVSVKWSADKRRVLSSYKFETDEAEYTYNYQNDGDNESVEISYSGSGYSEVITLKALDESGNATLVGFESRDSSEQGVQLFSAVGKANDDYGSLQADYNSVGAAEAASYSKKETFDNSGTLIKSSVCEENCDAQSAWKDGSSVSTSSSTVTINGDKNQTTTTITETITESPLIDVIVSGLEDGSYTIARQGFDGGFADKLGYGTVVDGVAEFSYWGKEDEIDDARVYTFQVIIDESGYRPAFIEIETATIVKAP